MTLFGVIWVCLFRLCILITRLRREFSLHAAARVCGKKKPFIIFFIAQMGKGMLVHKRRKEERRERGGGNSFGVWIKPKIFIIIIMMLTFFLYISIELRSIRCGSTTSLEILPVFSRYGLPSTTGKKNKHVLDLITTQDSIYTPVYIYI